ncbi:SDR family oxidoreductase [Methyloligella solikamskensis]|uniref:SDR family oxidoreductase n=1 Tax=Methyloligella solikamskensis TaxID=1177756 RepID=A0ABW3JCJ5_9HYPH
MRILVTGASGFIGAAICARMIAEGHAVVGAGRPGGSPLPRGLACEVTVDMARAKSPDDWTPHLCNIEAVVNCAGLLQAGSAGTPSDLHIAGVDALFAACEAEGIRRIVHISALGVAEDSPTEFAKSKHQGDEVLMTRDLDWVVLRPSVVLGRSAYGGSALIRGLAALPILPLITRSGPLQVVALDDVVESVVFFLKPDAPSRLVLELAGPERLSFEEVVAAYRRWFCWPPAQTVRLPDAIGSLLFSLGDFAGALGWRPPVRSTARKEILRGSTGDPGPWMEATGIKPQSLKQMLETTPPSVQERWFAKLFFLKPLTLIVFAAFWLVSGLIALGPGYAEGVEIMESAGTGALAKPIVIGGALADIVLGLAMLYRPTARPALIAAFILCILYLVVGTVLAPQMWSTPLGIFTKVVPIMALNLVVLALLEDR